MKRKTLGRLFAVTAAGFLSANAPIMAEAKELPNSGTVAEEPVVPKEEATEPEEQPCAPVAANDASGTAEQAEPTAQAAKDADTTEAPSDFAEATEKLNEAEKEAEQAQNELNDIQTEITAIQTGIPDAQKQVEATNAAKQQVATEKTNAEAEKKEADAAVSSTGQEADAAKEAWDNVINNAGGEADALQKDAEQLQQKRTELLEAENTVENLETECAAREQETKDTAQDKILIEASLQAKEELKENADKVVSDAQAELEHAQKEYEMACEAEETRNPDGTDADDTDAGGSDVNVDEVVNALKEAEQKIASGSLGFFQYLAETEDDAGAKAAVKILTSQDGTDIKGLRPAYLWRVDGWEQFYSYTHIGDENDATSLENMRRAIDFIEECNQLRLNDDNFQGCEPLTVNDAAMAAAQLNANWATYVNGSYHSHSAVFNTNENLAWFYLNRPGSNDPFKGWYDQEKAIYDSNGTGVTGHYLNITNRELSVTGFGVNLSDAPNGDTRLNCAQEFIREAYYDGYGYGATYSVSEYKERFYKYYYKALAELSNAQAAYDRILGMPGAQVAEKKAALYQSQEKLENAKANAERAQVLLEQVKEDLAALDQKYNAAMESYEKSRQDLENAKSVLEQKNNAYQALKQEIEGKYTNAADEMVALAETKAAYQKALLTQEKAADTLKNAQAAYNEAASAHTNAVHTLNNLQFASLADKNQELKKAQERYAQAFEKLTIAQGYYDRLNPNQGDVRPGETGQPSGTGQPTVTDRPNETAPSGGTDRQEPTDSQEASATQPETVSTETQENVKLFTMRNHDSRATFAKECNFSTFVRLSESIIKETSGGNLTLDCSDTPWFSLNKKALSALKGRTDVALTLLFRYGGKKYTFTIPAGFDLDSLQDSNGWYGFMYLKMIFGGHATE